MERVGVWRNDGTFICTMPAKDAAEIVMRMSKGGAGYTIGPVPDRIPCPTCGQMVPYVDRVPEKKSAAEAKEGG